MAEDNKTNRMARFKWIVGIQINLFYRDRHVIWSVELEYFQVNKHISKLTIIRLKSELTKPIIYK